MRKRRERVIQTNARTIERATTARTRTSEEALHAFVLYHGPRVPTIGGKAVVAEREAFTARARQAVSTGDWTGFTDKERAAYTSYTTDEVDASRLMDAVDAPGGADSRYGLPNAKLSHREAWRRLQDAVGLTKLVPISPTETPAEAEERRRSARAISESDSKSLADQRFRSAGILRSSDIHARRATPAHRKAADELYPLYAKGVRTGDYSEFLAHPSRAISKAQRQEMVDTHGATDADPLPELARQAETARAARATNEKHLARLRHEINFAVAQGGTPWNGQVGDYYRTAEALNDWTAAEQRYYDAIT